MLNNPTIQKLRDLKLKVMAEMLDEPDNTLRELSFEERFAIMVERQWQVKKNAKINRLLNNIKLILILGKEIFLIILLFSQHYVIFNYIL